MSELNSHFIKRRVHSLLGLIPIGAFLLEHTFTNSFSLGPMGESLYNEKIAWIQSLPFLVVMEVLFIFLPILFHALYGLAIWYQGSNNMLHYQYGASTRYVLQRLTGGIALVFIVYHVYATRITSLLTGQPMNYQWMSSLLDVPWKMWFYLIGTTAVVFHFANGIWTFMISWGITVSPAAQKAAFKVCMALFVVLAVTNWLIVVHFAYDQSQAPQPVAMVIDIVQKFLYGH